MYQQNSQNIQSTSMPSPLPKSLLERVAYLEATLSDTRKQLDWAHERISFLESGVGTAAPPQASAQVSAQYAHAQSTYNSLSPQ